ncbi:putative membrane protein YjcL [Drosera capensis]
MSSPPFAASASASFPSPPLSALPLLRPSLRYHSRLHGHTSQSRHTIPLFSSHRAIFLRNHRGFYQNVDLSRSVRVMSRFGGNGALIAGEDHWGLWASLLGIGAFGIWSEKTKIGSMVSPALVSILIGLAASNLRIIPFEAPAYSITNGVILALRTNFYIMFGHGVIPVSMCYAPWQQGYPSLRVVFSSHVDLFTQVFIVAVATMIGTLVAFFLVPMQSLGQDSWKIAAALMGSYIGGTVNFIAISEALGTSSSVVAAGVAADNVICAVYFMVLFALASKLPRESFKSTIDAAITRESASESKPVQLPTAIGIAVSFGICKLAVLIADRLPIQGVVLPGVTAIAVVLTTAFPSFFGYLAPSGEALSSVLLHVFFAVIGASGSILNVINTAPSIFLFAFVQVTVHLAVVLCLGKLFQFDMKLLLLASNANVGGPTTACGMATTKGWDSLIVPGILVGIFGISIATFLGIGFGLLVLRHL